MVPHNIHLKRISYGIPNQDIPLEKLKLIFWRGAFIFNPVWYAEVDGNTNLSRS